MEVNTKGTIYKITNNINGKVYIGQTTKNITKRFTQHKNNANYIYARSGIARAFKKYGVDNFKFDIICSCLDLQELNAKEMYFIKKYNSLAPNGYNLNTGGTHYLRTPEITNKIIQKNTGKKRTLESRTKMSKAQMKPVRIFNPTTNEEFIIEAVTKIGLFCSSYGVSTRTAIRKLKDKKPTKNGFFVEYLRKVG